MSFIRGNSHVTIWLFVGKAYMFFWNETTGKRDSTEVASSILKYVKLNFKKLRPGQEKTLKLWSDRRVGQNNN